MQLINQSYSILFITDSAAKHIEFSGRVCYNSTHKIGPNTSDKFIKMLLSRGHESPIEHAYASVLFTTNRSVTHELVRHRLASYSQESTRYVSYSNNMQFIRPVWFRGPVGTYSSDDTDTLDKLPFAEQVFIRMLLASEKAYKVLLGDGWRPEQAREILPNALATKIVVTANFREWRHIFRLRTSKQAHPQIRELMLPLLLDMIKLYPTIFEDIIEEREDEV